MIDLLRIHVVWSHLSSDGAEVADFLSEHFDGIGMEREGVAYRIPVRFASEPWITQSPLPGEIDLGRAVHNAIVLLHDDQMHDAQSEWSEYVRQLRDRINDRGGVDFLIPFGSPSGDRMISAIADDHVHYARRDTWGNQMSSDQQKTRLLLHVLFQTRRNLARLRGADEAERIFVSHAKADGLSVASAIVDFVNDRSQDVPLGVFYDAKELNAGEFYDARFEQEIAAGTLLAIVSDIYDSRPWCVYELTTAKRRHRPIILADVGEKRVGRTYPYGANLPKVRISPSQTDKLWIEQLLREVLSEGLRCDLFERQVDRVLDGEPDVLKLVRPPELLDLIDAVKLPNKWIVYPDPPLSLIESQIVEKALQARSSSARLITLGELS